MQAKKRKTETAQVTTTTTGTGGQTKTSAPETVHIGAEDREQIETAAAVEARQEAARRAMTAKSSMPADRPKPPDTKGMSLVQAAAANAAYKKRLAVWEAGRKAGTAGAQASAIER
jgi:hypothetical protein